MTTVYIGNIYEQTGAAIKKYYYAGGTRVAVNDNGTLYWLLGDHLGSTSLAANGTTGAWSSEQRYKPWGETRYTNGTTPTRRQYTGQINDLEMGLYFYNARFYSPYLNRWLSPDTIVPDPANPQSLNRYSYVNNRPLNFTDPSGHIAVCDDKKCPETTRSNPYGIRFTADKGVAWGMYDIDEVLHAASAIARALVSVLQQEDWYSSKAEGTDRQHFSKAKVFLQVFGVVTFNRNAGDCEGLKCGAWANKPVAGTIQVYAQIIGAGHYTFQNAAHELAHVFDSRAGRHPSNDLDAAKIGLDDTIIAGGGWPGSSYQRTNLGYATIGLSDWQQHPLTMEGGKSAGEDFADMFLGWTFDHFAQNAAGDARYNWMSTNMAEWTTLANR